MQTPVSESPSPPALFSSWDRPKNYLSGMQSTCIKDPTWVSLRWRKGRLNQVLYTRVCKDLWIPTGHTVNRIRIDFCWAILCQMSQGGIKSATNAEGRKAVVIKATANNRQKQNRYISASLTHPEVMILRPKDTSFRSMKNLHQSNRDEFNGGDLSCSCESRTLIDDCDRMVRQNWTCENGKNASTFHSPPLRRKPSVYLSLH